MDSAIALILGLLMIALLAAIVLPIVSLVVSVRTRRKLNDVLSRIQPGGTTTPQSLSDVVQRLTVRVARLESDSLPPTPAPRPGPPSEARPEAPPPTLAAQAPPIPPRPPQPQAAAPSHVQTVPARTIHADELESIIGRRWLGWAAVALIIFATAFFLKYAFDNRWIGELGRVTIGVAAGVALNGLGYRYHLRKWRLFSQILTGGGVVLLYLTAYASFGYYHLATQQAAFAYMVILIAEAAGLALLYKAPSIAVMALIGGFLVPVLLHSDRDQYRSFFSYIAALDAGALALLKHWPGLSALAFAGTHLLFWMWYVDHYHPQKLLAVMTFHTGVFLMFLLAHLARRLIQRQEIVFEDFDLSLSYPLRFISNSENLSLLLINPFVFFSTAYFFLNPSHHEWMGVFAIAMALLYAGAAKLLLDQSKTTKSELLVLVGIALTFVTLAIPIQLKSNWITMAWAFEGVLMLWAGIETRSVRLRTIAHLLFGLALVKLVFHDTPVGLRPAFTPVLNKFFLSSLFVVGCVFAAAFLYQKLGEQKQIAAKIFQTVLLIVAIAVLWFLMTVETHTFFVARAAKLKAAEDYQHERWLGQMALSVLWSIYAAVLAAVGFVRRAAAVRWAALSLFALTVIKVMLVDIAVLQQLYRIIAFLVLGLLLLLVTWGYHRAFHAKQPT